MDLTADKTREEKLADHARLILNIARGGLNDYKHAVVNTFRFTNENEDFTRDEIVAELARQGKDVQELFTIHAKAQAHLADIDPDYEVLSIS